MNNKKQIKYQLEGKHYSNLGVKAKCYRRLYDTVTNFSHAVKIIIICGINLFSLQTVASEEGPLYGVQRWDMYSGLGATQKQELGYIPGKQGYLVPEEWHHRAPFFARRTEDVTWIEHPEDAGPLWFNHPFDFDVLQEAMDQEIDYATDGGVDFWIFNGAAYTVIANGYHLHNNLDAYLLNTRQDKVKFVTALYGHPSIPYGRTKVNLMLDEVIGYMQLPEWQTVKDGRPLLPVLWPIGFKDHLAAQTDPNEQMTLAEFVQLIRDRVAAVGLQDPYLVGQQTAHTYNDAAEIAAAGFDAVSDYAGGYGGITATRDDSPTYAQATDTMLQTWVDNYLNSGVDVDYVPAMQIGNYAWPRAEGDTWYHYQLPEPGDITSRLQKTLAFVEENKAQIPAEVIFSYAWNEHSESGAINPTMGDAPNYIPNTRWIDEVLAGRTPVANVAVLATATSSHWSNSATDTAPTTIDGITDDWTGWKAKQTTEQPTAWVELAWDVERTINVVELYLNANSSGNYTLEQYTIQYWDGSAFQDITTVSGNTDAHVTSIFNDVTTTKLRIICTESGVTAFFRLQEIEVYKQVFPTYNVTINVTDGAEPIVGATVMLDDETVTSDGSGDVVFSDKIASTYNYTVSASGYSNVISNTEIVDADVTESVTLAEQINVALAATAVSSNWDNDSSGADPAPTLVDGNSADWSGWTAKWSEEEPTAWVELSWGTAQSIDRLEVFTTAAGAGYYALGGYTVQYWDGNAYQDVASLSGNTASQVGSTFTEVSTTKLRILCIEPDSGDWFRINEIEVYGNL